MDSVMVYNFFLFNIIKIPVKDVELKIYYQKPLTGIAQLYWTDAENKGYIEEKQCNQLIQNRICQFIIPKDLSNIKKLRIDFINDETDFSIRKIDFCIDGIPYKQIEGSELAEYITQMCNIKEQKKKGKLLSFKVENADPQIEVTYAFIENIQFGFQGCYNVYNIFLDILLCVFGLSIFFRKNIVKESDRQRTLVGILILSCPIVVWICPNVYRWRLNDFNIRWNMIFVILICYLMFISICFSKVGIAINKWIDREIIKVCLACLNVVMVEGKLMYLYCFFFGGLLCYTFSVFSDDCDYNQVIQLYEKNKDSSI